MRAVLSGKRSPEEVKTFGLHRTNIYKWLRQHKKGVWQALKSRKGTGKKPKLTKGKWKKIRYN